MSSVFNNIRVLGNLDVKGKTTSVDSTVVNIADNFLYLNNGLTMGAKSGGIIINYEATTVSATTAGGVGFAAGTVDVITGQTWGNDDFIQVSGALNSENNGLYQIISYTTNDPAGFDRITVTGGSPSAYVQNSFTPNATDLTATVTKVSIAVIQTTDSGVLQYGAANNSSSLSLEDIPIGNLDEYLKKGGIVGGQTAIGGLNPGDNLILQSTFDDSLKGSVIIDEMTPSTSTTTGALLVSGGVGVDKDVYVGGQIAVDNIIGNSPTAMNIGGTTSTGISLASDSTKTTVLGALSVLSSIDTNVVDATLALGATYAGSVELSGPGKYTKVLGDLTISGTIDTTVAGPMTIGGPIATTLNLGTGSAVTDVNIGTNAGTDVSVGNTTGLVKFIGSVTHNVVTISATTSFGNNAKHEDFGRIILLTGAVQTVTLPNSATTINNVNNGDVMDGKIITIINGAVGVKTITAGDADKIDGDPTITLNSMYDRTTLVYENTNKRWYVI
jgi:hypothetical protein